MLSDKQHLTRGIMYMVEAVLYFALVTVAAMPYLRSLHIPAMLAPNPNPNRVELGLGNVN